MVCYRESVCWRVAQIVLILCVILMFPTSVLYVLNCAWYLASDKTNVLYKIGYYGYYVGFFGYPVLAVICYRKALKLLHARCLHQAFLIVLIPIIIAFASMGYLASQLPWAKMIRSQQTSMGVAGSVD